MTILSFEKEKHGYLFYTWSDKAIEGTAVNRASYSINGGFIWSKVYVFIEFLKKKKKKKKQKPLARSEKIYNNLIH